MSLKSELYMFEINFIIISYSENSPDISHHEELQDRLFFENLHDISY